MRNKRCTAAYQQQAFTRPFDTNSKYQSIAAFLIVQEGPIIARFGALACDAAAGRTSVELDHPRPAPGQAPCWEPPAPPPPATPADMASAVACILSEFPMYFYFGTKTTSFGSPALTMRAPPPHIVRENTRNGDCLACETHRP